MVPFITRTIHGRLFPLILLAAAGSYCACSPGTVLSGNGNADGGGTPSDAAGRPVDLATMQAPSDLSGGGSGGDDAGGTTPDLWMPVSVGGERYFPEGSPWYTDVSGAKLDAESAMVIAGLQAAGGWGLGRFQIDFGLTILRAEANTPMRAFTKNNGFYEPDCDHVPVPVPMVGAIEGEDGYRCENEGDCHLIVAHPQQGKLYEMWVADIRGPQEFNGGCLAVWDMNRVYPPSGRGEQCTSADAAGYPIAPLTPQADEVWAAVQKQGSLNHALRFILPNGRIRRGVYLHPATHGTGSTSGGNNTPPYGSRLRLRPDYPLQSLPNEAARVIARTLMRYGMFLADGGNVALSFGADRFAEHKWEDMNFDSRSMAGILATDFVMIDGGERIRLTNDCVRN